MYRLSVAISIALATAALFVVLTEPQRESELSQSGLSVIVRTASKADRLDMRGASVCTPKPAAPNLTGDGVRRHQPPGLRSSGRIVLVSVAD